jgi:hypothetical protein
MCLLQWKLHMQLAYASFMLVANSHFLTATLVKWTIYVRHKLTKEILVYFRALVEIRVVHHCQNGHHQRPRLWGLMLTPLLDKL